MDATSDTQGACRPMGRSGLGVSEAPASTVGAGAPPRILGKVQLKAGAPPKVLLVIGPTGVGKSRLGLEICVALEERGIAAEIISADSMQVSGWGSVGSH